MIGSWLRSIGTIAAVLSVAACATAPARVVIGIGNQAPLQDVFQKWLLIDDRQPRREMLGTIEAVHLNRGIPFADGDWNIIVQPDPAYRQLLVNRAGIANADDAVELEIRSAWPEEGLDLAREFPEGAHVRATGWWVEDSGHSSKTELHPLVVLQTTQAPYAIFVGQDLTGRFAVARTRLDVTVAMPAAPVPAVRNLSSGAREPGQESAFVETSRGSFTSTLEAGGRAMAISLARGEGSRRALGDVLPYYFARFETAAAPSLTDEATVTKRFGEDGRPFLQADITATLSYDGGIPSLRSQGWLLDGAQSSERRFSATLKYAPGLGFSNHTWELEGYGETDSSGNTPRSRTIVRARARYTIDPSSASLSSAATDRGYAVSATVRKAHPLLQSVFLWQVSTKDRGPVPVAEGVPVEVEGVTFLALQAGVLNVDYPPGKRRAVSVAVTGVTDIGEHLSAALALLSE